MEEVTGSNQLATGLKEKNILSGANDIISAIDFINKKKKPAYLGSYDMVIAYDRAMMRFLLLVMERMEFPDTFRRWTMMLHQDATTCLVFPNGLSRIIKLMFNFRQGDPIAMHRYIFFKMYRFSSLLEIFGTFFSYQFSPPNVY